MLRPAWGYVDQPPLTPLLARLFSAVLADAPWAIRIPATLAAAGSVLVVAALTREFGGGRGAGAGGLGLRGRGHPHDHGSRAAHLDDRPAGLAGDRAVHRPGGAARATGLVAGRRRGGGGEHVQQAAGRAAAGRAGRRRAGDRRAPAARRPLGARRCGAGAVARRPEPGLPGPARLAAAGDGRGARRAQRGQRPGADVAVPCPHARPAARPAVAGPGWSGSGGCAGCASSPPRSPCCWCSTSSWARSSTTPSGCSPRCTASAAPPPGRGCGDTAAGGSR